MSQHTIQSSPQNEPRTLSFWEKREILSKKGITASRVTQILELKSPVTLACALKKIGMKDHFSELPLQGNARVIQFTRAWVRALLKQLAPTEAKKATKKGKDKNIVPMKPREPGILFADFEKQFRNMTGTSLSLTPTWAYLIQNYLSFFTLVKSESSGKPIYQLKETYKEDAMRLAKDHIQRGKSSVIQKKAGT